jgi:hypothetical protein
MQYKLAVVFETAVLTITVIALLLTTLQYFPHLFLLRHRHRFHSPGDDVDL